MNKLEPIYAVIKDKAREQEKFYFKNWGLEPRNEHSFERMLTLQVVWAIGSMITVFSAVLFSFVLSRAPIVGLTLPAIFWVFEFYPAFYFYSVQIYVQEL